MSAYQPYTTYSTKRISFVGNPEQRTGASASKDQIFINFYPAELKGVEGTKYFLEQRPGLVYQRGTIAGEGRGIYYWNGFTFYVVGNTLYKDNTALQVLSTSTGAVGFQEFANATNQNFLVVLDGTSGWVINQSSTVTKITSPNFPTPHVVHAGYLDGYLVVAKVGTADLYNCNLLDPLVWTAGDFITAEAFPDPVVAVCRQNNYIVALGTQVLEYFYDTGTYPGTPFERNSAASHQIGTPAPDTLAQIEEQLVFVGQTQTGGRTVWVMNGFNPSEIGTEIIRQSLDHEGSNISNAKAYCVRVKGHKFYVLQLTSMTWVYDFNSQMWHQWADAAGTSKFSCDYASDSIMGSPLMIDRTRGYVFSLMEGICQDATSPTASINITSTAISDRIDFGNMNHKFMHRFSLMCDVPNVGNSTSCTLYWTDNDYISYSSGRVISISDTMPTITQLGMFRRRAFKLVYSDAYPIRIEGFEVDINAGSQ